MKLVLVAEFSGEENKIITKKKKKRKEHGEGREKKEKKYMKVSRSYLRQGKI